MKLEFDSGNQLEVLAVKTLVDTLASRWPQALAAGQPTTMDEDTVARLSAMLDGPAAAERPATHAPSKGGIVVNASNCDPENPWHKDAPDSSDDEAVACDMKGVPFNPITCGESKEPFYGTGKRSGQWKKKRGVDQDVYDKWYEEALAAATLAEPMDDQPADTAAAFDAAPPPPPPAEPAAECEFKDAGGLFGWIAEQQAAGNMPQERIDAAYAATGVNMQDLFPPANPDAIAAAVAKLHAELSK